MPILPGTGFPYPVGASLPRRRSRRLGGLSPGGRDQRPRAAVVAVLAEEDALPGSEREAAAGDRQGQRGAEQGGLYMGGHVVVALEGVGPVGSAFGNGAVEPGLEVVPHVG